MVVYKWKHENAKQHLLGWVQGFAGILDGLITVISFGLLASGFEINIAAYRAKVYFQDMKRNA